MFRSGDFLEIGSPCYINSVSSSVRSLSERELEDPVVKRAIQTFQRLEEFKAEKKVKRVKNNVAQ